MRTKITNKELKNGKICLRIDSCLMFELSEVGQQQYYNSGIYGRNYDVEVFDHYALIEGYRVFSCEKLSDELSDKIMNFIKKTREKSCSWQKNKPKIEKFVIETLNKAIMGGKK